MGDGIGGYVLTRTSPILKEMKTWVRWALQYYNYEGTIPMYKERGVYNMYLEVQETEQTVPLCVKAQASGSDGAGMGGSDPLVEAISGNRRQGNSP